MDRGDNNMMERGRGRAPRQTSAPGDALQKSSSGYGTGEKSQTFGTASIVRYKNYLFFYTHY